MSVSRLELDNELIESLAYEGAMLRERVRDVTAERDSYRELAQQAIHALADMTHERARLTDRLYRLTDELRELRGLELRAA